MKNRIEIYPDKKHLDSAYGLYCEKRFRALLVEKSGEGIYEGDSLAMSLFLNELRKAGVLFMPLISEDKKIELI